MASLGKTKNHHATIDMYRALEESHLWYAYVVWGALPNTKLRNLQKYKNRAFISNKILENKGCLQQEHPRCERTDDV